jgi:hypothetical protein
LLQQADVRKSDKSIAAQRDVVMEHAASGSEDDENPGSHNSTMEHIPGLDDSLIAQIMKDSTMLGDDDADEVDVAPGFGPLMVDTTVADICKVFSSYAFHTARWAHASRRFKNKNACSCNLLKARAI